MLSTESYWHTSFKAHFLNGKNCKQEFGSANCTINLICIRSRQDCISLRGLPWTWQQVKFLAYIDGCWYVSTRSSILFIDILFEFGFKINFIITQNSIYILTLQLSVTWPRINLFKLWFFSSLIRAIL